MTNSSLAAMFKAVLLLAIFANVVQCSYRLHRYPCSMKYKITTEWDSKPIQHKKPVEFTLSWKYGDDFLTAEFDAPFFNDPDAPDGPPGEPFPMLWEYEVVEIFFLNSRNDHYLEVEVSPHGQHLVLLLNATRSLFTYKLPMVYTSTIDECTNTWKGTAQIPLSYIPRYVNKMNAYAIHGSGKDRVFESLYPVPEGKYENPEFHRLGYFQPFNLRKIVKDQRQVGTFWDEEA